MSTPASSSSESAFLGLPLSVRQKVYSYLLSPDSEQSITTINYTLEWPFLQNPRNSTFTPHKLDVCRCTGSQPRTTNRKTEDHVYTRYICRGPEVRFTPKSGELWLLQAPGAIFNILRPASPLELQQRPDAGIILANRQCYKESLPFLYKGRNFLCLTGPCPRGRYQAYATQTFLSRLSAFARQHVTCLSLLCQTWEEDCQSREATRAYVDLVRFLPAAVPNLRDLCLNHWSTEVDPRAFATLLRRDAMRIFLSRDAKGGTVQEFCDMDAFMKEYDSQTSARVGKRKGHRRGASDPQVEKPKEHGSEVAETQRKLSLADDWVLAGLTPTGSGGGSDTDIWDMI